MSLEVIRQPFLSATFQLKLFSLLILPNSSRVVFIRLFMGKAAQFNEHQDVDATSSCKPQLLLKRLPLLRRWFYQNSMTFSHKTHLAVLPRGFVKSSVKQHGAWRLATGKW